MENIQFEGKCYVVPQIGQVAHPITKHRHDLLWYPEWSMSLITQTMYQPYVQSIVTESPWLIGCYDREDVFVWEKIGRRKAKWVNPNCQTFGADLSSILFKVLKFQSEMPQMVLDGGKIMKKHIKTLEKAYKV